jgi:hypothetical protein
LADPLLLLLALVFDLELELDALFLVPLDLVGMALLPSGGAKPLKSCGCSAVRATGSDSGCVPFLFSWNK